MPARPAAIDAWFEIPEAHRDLLRRAMVKLLKGDDGIGQGRAHAIGGTFRAERGR